MHIAQARDRVLWGGQGFPPRHLMVPYTASSVLCWKFSERLAEEATKAPNRHVVSKQDQVPKREEKVEGILSGVSQKEAAWGYGAQACQTENSGGG